MASPYKFPLMAAFLAATGFSIWTGAQVAKNRGGANVPLSPLKTESPLKTDQTILTTSPSAEPKTVVADKDSEKNKAIASSNQSLLSEGIEVEECVITMAEVNDPRPPLSIRDAPSPEGNIVSEADNGQIIDVAGTKGNWFAVTAPVQGWAPRSLTKAACNQKTARLAFGRGRRSIDVSGTFVGTGSHQYKLQASKNQTLTLTNQAGVMPVLKSPDNQVLFSGPDEGDPAQWSGKLTTDGEYTLEIDSGYRGYEYRFNARLK